jgi:preprotein translocase subunit SecB
MQKSTMLAEAAKNLDMEAVARVAQKADLEEIYLVDAKMSRISEDISVETLSLEHKCSTKIISKEEDILSIRCNFGVTAFRNKSPDKIVMNIEASFCTSYVLKPITDINPDDIEHFAKINPVYNAWAYWREFVQSMTTRMDFPALTIPLLKIVPKKSKEKEIKRQPIKKEATRRKKVDA